MKTITKKPVRTVFSISTDRRFKDQAKQFAHRLGLSLSDFAKASMRKSMNEGSLTVEPELIPTPYLEKILKKAEADLKAGKNIVGPFETNMELEKYLDSL